MNFGLPLQLSNQPLSIALVHDATSQLSNADLKESFLRLKHRNHFQKLRDNIARIR